MATSSKVEVAIDQEVLIHVGRETIGGALTVPSGATGIVLFAHGSGSSRHSPRNRAVAQAFFAHGLGTFLIDLLTAREERVDIVTAEHRFNIALMAERVFRATDWLAADGRSARLRVGYFGASTGAAAAIVAAARRSDVAAIVSRGGRPDLAGAALLHVELPTLLIVGALDTEVLELNRRALQRMERCAHKEIHIVPRATHLFEELGALEVVAQLAITWFHRWLSPPDEGSDALP